MPYPQSANKVSLPDPPRIAGVLHGIPDAVADYLPELLTEARRLRGLGRPADDVRRAVLQLARNLPVRLPLFSHGGLCECLDAVLAEVAG